MEKILIGIRNLRIVLQNITAVGRAESNYSHANG